MNRNGEKDEYPYQTSVEELQLKRMSRYFEYYHDYPDLFWPVYVALFIRIAGSLKNWVITFLKNLLIGLGFLVCCIGLLIYSFIFSRS